MAKSFAVYILASDDRKLYVGVTSRLKQRVWEHKNGVVPGYTSRHGIHHLVYWEQTSNAVAAIQREKQLKGLRRIRKIALIEGTNPAWRDLAQDL